MLVTLAQFTETHLKETGCIVFDAGNWRRDDDCLRLSLRSLASGGGAFHTKKATLPSDFLLREARLSSGAVLASESALGLDGAWEPCADLRLLATGNAAAQRRTEVLKCVRWFHGTSNMILCLCANSKIITVKEHEVDAADEAIATFRACSQAHGWWYEIGALLVVTFNHNGREASASSHALFFDQASRAYKGLVMWRYGKVCVQAGEVEARPASLPKIPSLEKSTSSFEGPTSIIDVREVELPTPDQCEMAYRGLNPSQANLVLADYLGFLLKLMATNGLDSVRGVSLAKQCMRIANLASHFCLEAQPPTYEQVLASCSVRHQDTVCLVVYSLAGEEVGRQHVHGVVGPSAALSLMTDVVQPSQGALGARPSYTSWLVQSIFGNAAMIQIEVGNTLVEEGSVVEYNFHAVRIANKGLSLKDIRSRLSSWGLTDQLGFELNSTPKVHLLPSQLGMVLQDASAEARHQFIQEYAVQLQNDIDRLASNPIRGSHYIVLLDVSGSMRMDNFLRVQPSEINELEDLGLDANVLIDGNNITIVQHILDAYFVPSLLQKGINVGNAKFSDRLVRIEAPSCNPTPFSADSHLNGGGTEIYCSLMAAAARLSLPVLDMTGNAGVILITDGEQRSTKLDIDGLGTLFNRNFRLDVICIRSQFAWPLQKLVKRSFSAPWQIGNLKNFCTALKETVTQIEKRVAMSPENRSDIRQPVELFHPNMWYLLND